MDSALRVESPDYLGPAVLAAAMNAGIQSKKKETELASQYESVCGPFRGPEFSGAIYKLPNSIIFTEAPVLSPQMLWSHNRKLYNQLSDAERSIFQPSFGLSNPAAARRPCGTATLVAYWHTHPNNISFSESDRQFVKRHGIPLFLIREKRLGRGLVFELLVPESL